MRKGPPPQAKDAALAAIAPRTPEDAAVIRRRVKLYAEIVELSERAGLELPLVLPDCRRGEREYDWNPFAEDGE